MIETLTDYELHERMMTAAQKEKSAALELLEYLSEVEIRGELPQVPAEFQTPKSRLIPRTERNAVRIRSHDQCEFWDRLTGRRCESRRYLELHHCKSSSLARPLDPTHTTLPAPLRLLNASRLGIPQGLR